MPSLAGKTIAQNTMWLLLAEFASRIVVFAVIVWLANYLGDTAYGELGYAFAVANLLVVLADFGLSTYVVREVARNLTTTSTTISHVLGVKLILSVITMLLIILCASIISNLNVVVIVAGGAAIILSNLRMFLEAFFRAHQKMNLEALTKITAGLLLAAITATLILFQASLERIALGYVISSAISVGLASLILFQRIAHFHLYVSRSLLTTTLRASWPFALSLAFNYIFNYLDSAMLGWFGQTTAVGWYTAAYKPIFFITAIAGVIINAFFPVITQQYEQHSAQLSTTVSHLLKINMLVAWPMAIGGSILAADIIHLLYTPEYEPAVLAFQILTWSTAAIYLWAVFGNTLQACDGQRQYVKNFSIAAGLNIILNAALIPWWSLYGAALATGCTQVLLIWLMYRDLKPELHIAVFSAVWKPAIAAATMGVVLLLLPPLALGWSIVIGVISYGVMIAGVRGLRQAELQLFLTLWRKPKP